MLADCMCHCRSSLSKDLWRAAASVRPRKLPWTRFCPIVSPADAQGDTNVPYGVSPALLGQYSVGRDLIQLLTPVISIFCLLHLHFLVVLTISLFSVSETNVPAPFYCFPFYHVLIGFA